MSPGWNNTSLLQTFPCNNKFSILSIEEEPHQSEDNEIQFPASAGGHSVSSCSPARDQPVAVSSDAVSAPDDERLPSQPPSSVEGSDNSGAQCSVDSLMQPGVTAQTEQPASTETAAAGSVDSCNQQPVTTTTSAWDSSLESADSDSESVLVLHSGASNSFCSLFSLNVENFSENVLSARKSEHTGTSIDTNILCCSSVAEGQGCVLPEDGVSDSRGSTADVVSSFLETPTLNVGNYSAVQEFEHTGVSVDSSSLCSFVSSDGGENSSYIEEQRCVLPVGGVSDSPCSTVDDASSCLETL